MSKTDSFFIVFILIVWGIGGFPVALCAQGAAGVLPETHLVEVGKGYSQTSVNTAVFRNNSLVTQGDEQYISYYDAEGFLTLGKRNLHAGQWTLHRTQYKGNVKDAHNVISMMLDGDGYIHVAFDHHGQPLNYCRSIAPHSLELGEKEPMTGVDEGNVSGVLSAVRRRPAVCIPFRFFRPRQPGDEPLFLEREEMEPCAGCAD